MTSEVAPRRHLPARPEGETAWRYCFIPNCSWEAEATEAVMIDHLASHEMFEISAAACIATQHLGRFRQLEEWRRLLDMADAATAMARRLRRPALGPARGALPPGTT